MAARTFAQYGLSQSLPLGKRWTLDATLDASITISGHDSRGRGRQRVPAGRLGRLIASAQDRQHRDGDYTAATLGATYRAARWSWNGRLEYRDCRQRRSLGHHHATSCARWAKARRSRRASAPTRVTRQGRRGATLCLRRPRAGAAPARQPLVGARTASNCATRRADAGFTDGNVLGVPAYGGGDQVTLARDQQPRGQLSHRRRRARAMASKRRVYYGAKYVAGASPTTIYDRLYRRDRVRPAPGSRPPLRHRRAGLGAARLGPRRGRVQRRAVGRRVARRRTCGSPPATTSPATATAISRTTATRARARTSRCG